MCKSGKDLDKIPQFFLSLTHTCLWICVCIGTVQAPSTSLQFFRLNFECQTDILHFSCTHRRICLLKARSLDQMSVAWKENDLYWLQCPCHLHLCWWCVISSVQCHFFQDSFVLKSWSEGPTWAGAKHNERCVNRWTGLESVERAWVWVLKAELTGGNGQMSVCTVVRGTYHC